MKITIEDASGDNVLRFLEELSLWINAVPVDRHIEIVESLRTEATCKWGRSHSDFHKGIVNPHDNSIMSEVKKFCDDCGLRIEVID